MMDFPVAISTLLFVLPFNRPRAGWLQSCITRCIQEMTVCRFALLGPAGRLCGQYIIFYTLKHVYNHVGC
jgi:hypothetical protein